MLPELHKALHSAPYSGHAHLAAALLAGLLMVVGCTAPPPPPPPPPPATPASLPPLPAPPPPVALQPTARALVSNAGTPREFRQDGARHIYNKYPARIYKGRLQPLLYAVGVYEVDLDARGNVLKTGWLRAPSHAPEVMAEIDRMVRAAAPFPAPARMGRVTYTDTWLWDESGRFQLDTLTEGQN